MDFKEWLLSEAATRPGAKQGLYPLGYGGVGLYPACDMMNWSADAFTYMPQRMNVGGKAFKMIWGDGILSNPNPGEKNKEGWPEGKPDLGKFKMIWGDGILANPERKTSY